MLRSFIVEDEKKSRDALVHLLAQNCPEVEIAGFAENVKDAAEALPKVQPDLIFLDVMLPDGSGFDVLEKLHGLQAGLIFTTASEKFAIKAIKYSALDYLLKPIEAAELKAAVQKVVERKNALTTDKNLASLLENIKKSEEQYSKITLPTGNAYEVVAVKDIVRCEANDNYTNIYLAGGKKFLVSGTLKHYEELLPEKDFVRVHHSHLINMNHMLRFLKEDGGYAVMSDGSKVEISRRKKEDFMKRIR